MEMTQLEKVQEVLISITKENSKYFDKEFLLVAPDVNLVKPSFR